MLDNDTPPPCPPSNPPVAHSYLAHGTGTDYMYEVLRVPMSFTWEIYGDATAPYEDCFRMFNPLTKPAFEVRHPWQGVCWGG